MRHGFYPQPRIGFARGRWFHNLIVSLDKFEHAPAGVWLAAAALAGAGACALWPGARAAAGLALAVPLAIEAGVLLFNQRSLRSPGPFAGPFILFSIGHVGATALLALPGLPLGWRLAADVAVQVGLLGMMLYGSLLEPFRLQWNEYRLDLAGRGPEGGSGAAASGTAEIRVLLLADLHLARRGPREETLLRWARAFRPDLILFPGDLTNLSFVGDELTAHQTREVLRELRALAPVYVSRGTADVDPRWWVSSLVDGTGAVFLDHGSADCRVAGVELLLVGVPYDGPEAEQAASLARLLAGADGRPVVLLAHSPDLIEHAARLGVALHVAGHTHGGQVCIPLFGPPFTSSKFGRRYASGVHRVGAAALVVSRGVGMEGGGMPRLRFLAPPEVIGLTLRVPHVP
jgi:uncharacterized protein